jgi:hypothetical protein
MRSAGVVPAQTSMPSFIIVGAAKSGTTSLYNYLKQHPSVYMSPVKETSYFIAEDRETTKEIGPSGCILGGARITNLVDYQALFRDATIEKARGEASPKYLYYPGTAQRIKKILPDAKIIVILRHPVDRAYSNFLHHLRDGREPLNNFATALREEPVRISEGWGSEYHYRNRGFYYKQLSPYFAAFGAEAIHVFLYDDLRNDAVGVMQKIYRVLGVDETFVPNVRARYNVSGIPKRQSLHHVYRFLQGSNRSTAKEFGKRVLPKTVRSMLKSYVTQRLYKYNLAKPQLPAEVRKELQESYEEDILNLQKLINRDLSHWIKGDKC